MNRKQTTIFFWCVWFRVRVAYFICKQLETEWGISCCTVISVVATMENEFINVASFSGNFSRWPCVDYHVAHCHDIGWRECILQCYFFASHCDTCVESIDKLLRSLICGNGRLRDGYCYFFCQSCVACRQIFMRLVMLLVCIFMIYDCYVGHFCVMLENYYQSFMFNSAKQHSVAQIDGIGVDCCCYWTLHCSKFLFGLDVLFFHNNSQNISNGLKTRGVTLYSCFGMGLVFRVNIKQIWLCRLFFC